MITEPDCIPFEEEDPELGELMADYLRRRPFEGKGILYFKEGFEAALVFTARGLMTFRKFAAWLKGETLPKTERNAACPCGSGRKYKQCCFRYER